MQSPDKTDMDIEGGGQSAGVPADGHLDGSDATLGSRGMRHWRESTITRPGLDDRGNVFFAAIEMTRMPMILTDPNQDDNPIAFANKAFLDLTGYEEAEIVGRNCRFLQGSQTDRTAVAELRRTVEARGSIALEILNYKRDGTPFWNAVFIGPVYDVHGKLLYFFASQLDVTRRRNIEQTYRQAQKMEAIGQLTAGLAHDFNNLLQVVTGNLELLAGRVEDERGKRYLGNARTAAERGEKLTRQLLAFARKSRLDPHAFDLNHRITAFSDVMRSSLGKRVTLRLDLQPGLPAVLIDPDQFEMAMLNIVVNARDAMPEGGVVTIATGKTTLGRDASSDQLSSGHYVSVEVRDEGAGMEPHIVQRATEPFFTTKPTGKGTGLGLPMASGFVQQSRGRFEIESEPGRGTTIRMLFPVAIDEADATPDDTAKQGHKGVRPTERILIVEDSAEVLELAKEILSDAGYDVVTATNGEEGLAAFAAASADRPFDLLFTDLVMPGGINGILLAREVAKLDPGAGILMTTGYNEELVVEGPERPGLDVLGKPYRRDDLLDRIRQALDQRGSDGQRRRASDFGPATE